MGCESWGDPRLTLPAGWTGGGQAVGLSHRGRALSEVPGFLVSYMTCRAKGTRFSTNEYSLMRSASESGRVLCSPSDMRPPEHGLSMIIFRNRYFSHGEDSSGVTLARACRCIWSYGTHVCTAHANLKAPEQSGFTKLHRLQAPFKVMYTICLWYATFADPMPLTLTQRQSLHDAMPNQDICIPSKYRYSYLAASMALYR